VTGFIAQFQIVTTSNYNALANSCLRLLTIAQTKSSQFIFTSRFLVADPNSFLCLRPYWLANISQLPPSLAAISHQPLTFLIARTAQKTPFLVVIIQLLLWKHAYLRSFYSVTALVHLLISRSFPSNGSVFTESFLRNGSACFNILP
jgi:hypothetical protein